MIEGGKVDHVQYQLQPVELGFIFDAPFGKAGRSFLNPYLVDTGREGEVGENGFFLCDGHIGSFCFQKYNYLWGLLVGK